MISERVMLAFSKLNNAGGCYSVDLEKALCAVVEACESRKHHDDDCADQGETFGPDETCECGAASVVNALQELEQRLRECEK